MNTQQQQPRRSMTEADLVREGFDEQQIIRLTLLRERYPVIEFVDADELWRLIFLKWCYAKGYIKR